MKKQYLNEGWQLNYQGKQLFVTVPGCVHTDLMKKNLLDDPFWRDNNQNLQWIEKKDWEYSCVFDASLGKNTFLVCEGLDTYSEIFLNGVKLGETNDMFIPHRFDVSALLHQKGNQLSVRFRSPVKEVQELPEMEGAFTTERLYTRRMQCTYGWDWVDRFVTCGIYRPVYLEYENGIDVENIYIATENIDSFSAQIYTEINFKNFEKGEIAHVEILDPNNAVVVSTDFYANLRNFVRRFDIVDPQLWFPNGYGEQPLYRMRITVGKNVFEEIFGIRTLKILQLADEDGSEYRNKALEVKNSDAGKLFSHNEETSGFQVIVNGKRIFCQGGNWVPCEPFPSEESDEKIKQLVGLAKHMGTNLLRVWGGGLFEKKVFYDECDRLGILVIQDFLMACGHYPEKEEWFVKAISEEAEFAIKYLRNHPCLAWWHGDNENATWESELKEDYNGRDSALIGSAPQVYKYDRFRSFLPSTPYGGDTYGSLTKGTSHITNYIVDIFNFFHFSDCVDYKEFLEQYLTRFSCEDGTFGAMCRSSMLKIMTEDDLLRDPDEKMIYYHSKNNPVLERHILGDIISFARKVLGEFTDGEDKFFKYKYIQYEWVRVVFENIRRNLGYSSGMVFWMYNDCWPASMGWSFVDYYGLPKASYYSFKRCAARLIGSLAVEDQKYLLALSSITEMNRFVSITAYIIKNYAITKKYFTTLSIGDYGVETVALPWNFNESNLVVCDVECNGVHDRCFYKTGTLELMAADHYVKVMERTHNSITVQASSYVHAVEFEGDYIFEDNYFSMLPGEIRIIQFEKVESSANNGIEIKSYTIKDL